MVLTRLKAVRDFVDYTREQLADLFKPHDPEFAHEHFDKAEMASMLGAWKPSFIHSDEPRTWSAHHPGGRASPPGHPLRLPKPRTSFPVGHLTTGIAYRLSVAPRRVVQRARAADQLVAAGLRGPRGQRMSFDLPSFDRAVSQQLRRV